MMQRRRKWLAASVTVTLAAVPLSFGVSSATAHATPRLLPESTVVRALSGTSTPATTDYCLAHSGGLKRCYVPSQLQAAYDVGPLFTAGDTGKGQTIVLIDCFGSPTIAHDLATFDATFSLPAPPHFTVITPAGRVPAFSANATDRVGWAVETSLDVEWAHAMAPDANIVLAETPTDEVEGVTGFPEILKAENYVVTHYPGSIVSMSFGATEQTFGTWKKIVPFRAAFLAGTKKNVTFVSGTGDTGSSNYEVAMTLYPHPVIAWPASDPLVTAVGGTKLSLDDAGVRVAPDAVWNDSRPGSPSASGGGVSSYFSRPTFQSSVAGVVGVHRGVPDVTMSGSCTGLVNIYLGISTTSSPAGWYSVCGTSESSPLFAGIVALADQRATHALGNINPALYAMSTTPNNGLVPVTVGNNTVSVSSPAGILTVPGYSASATYNLATGLGTIDAALFVPALVTASAQLASAHHAHN